jgi:hypothetical protein
MRADASRYRIVRRRTPFILALAIGIVALALPTFLYFQLVRLQGRLAISAGQIDDGSTLPIMLSVYANAVLFLVPAVFLFWYGSRTLHAGAFPPPGTWAFEGQEVQLGSRASLRALLAFGAGACCLAIGVAWIALAVTVGRIGS